MTGRGRTRPGLILLGLAPMLLCGGAAVAALSYFARTAPGHDEVYGPRRVALCTYTAHDVGTLPPDFEIVRNGEYHRTYLGPPGGSQPQAHAVPLPDEVLELTQDAPAAEDGTERFHVWEIASDGTFAYRMTERLISGDVVMRGAGTCGPFEDRYEEAA